MELVDAGPFIAIFIFAFVFGIGALVLMIVALVDAARVPHDAMYRTGTKVMWILLIIFVGIIGPILYFAIGRPAKEVREGAVTGVGPYAGAVSIDYRGARYSLGRTASAYVIWDGAAGGIPIRTFPLTPEGWSQAWTSYYQELEGPPPPAPPAPS